MKKLLYALPILILLLLPGIPAYAFTGNLDGRESSDKALL